MSSELRAVPGPGPLGSAEGSPRSGEGRREWRSAPPPKPGEEGARPCRAWPAPLPIEMAGTAGRRVERGVGGRCFAEPFGPVSPRRLRFLGSHLLTALAGPLCEVRRRFCCPGRGGAAVTGLRGDSAARFRAWRRGSAGKGREEGVAVFPPARRRVQGGDLGSAGPEPR